MVPGYAGKSGDMVCLEIFFFCGGTECEASSSLLLLLVVLGFFRFLNTKPLTLKVAMVQFSPNSNKTLGRRNRQETRVVGERDKFVDD
jgi:hypothetical protein